MLRAFAWEIDAGKGFKAIKVLTDEPNHDQQQAKEITQNGLDSV